MKKFILIFISIFSIMFFISITNINAKSTPSFNSKYWMKSRTVRVIKKQKAYMVKMAGKDWATSTKILKNKVLKKGQKIRILYGGASWAWTLPSKDKKGLWVMNKPLNTKWFKLIK
ncbi:Spc97/Spc98 family protein [Apilactobacillus micheneri]|uniref:Spc97/Spc98 family protein n=1 Tax=Apilactobacillus micheneri TaxID=1899430 RepID=UPI00112E8414|nr:Spc97/Spc98 family protein [Apilactobacillus micheneri]TPR52525.1 hypothetical protein DY126_01660 [Apilactobacillus micheneri]